MNTSELNQIGLEDAIESLQSLDGSDIEIRLFAVHIARQVQPLMLDVRSVKAVDVAERFANGLASSDELNAAYDAAWDAVDAAKGSSSWDSNNRHIPAYCAARAAMCSATPADRNNLANSALHAYHDAFDAAGGVIDAAISSKFADIFCE